MPITLPSPHRARGPQVSRWLLPCALALTSAFLLPGCKSGSSSKPRVKAVASDLTVQDTTPTADARGVAAGTSIEVSFSETVDFSTVTTASFTVTGSLSGLAGGAFIHEEARKRIRFSPAAAFLAAESVTVRLSAAILSTNRQPLRAVEFSFSIAANDDPEPPPPAAPTGLQVLSTTPSPHSNNVPVNAGIQFQFTQAVGSGSLTDAVVTVWSRSTGRLAARLELSADGLTLGVMPLRPLPPADLIVVRLAASLRAANGDAFAGYSLELNTQALPPPSARLDDRVLSTLGNVRAVQAADLDLDGFLDLAYSSENETFVDLLAGVGDGTFVLGLRVDLGVNVLSVALGDLDADGDPDLVVGASDRASVFWSLAGEENESGARILLGDGPVAPLGTPARGITLGDIDHRGNLDMVLDTDRGLQILLESPGAAPAQTIGLNRQARTNVVLSDLDLDGQADLTYGNRRGGQLTYHLRTPSGTEVFGAARQVSLGTDAEQIAVANLSADMHPEILVLTLGSPGTGAELRMLSRSGPAYTLASFAVPMTSDTGAPAVSDGLETGRFTVADLDGNGFLDPVFAAPARGEVYWIANHSGVLDLATGPRLLLRAPGMMIPLAADLNADGSLEVVAAGAQEIHNLLPLVAPLAIGAEDRFELAVDDAQWRQGDSNVAVLVRATSTRPLDAYSVAMKYDPAAISPLQASTDGTATGTAGVEFADFERYFAEGAVSYKVIVEFGQPFEGRTIPAGENQLLFRLHFDVAPAAPLGELPLRFLESVGAQNIPTAFLIGAETVRPQVRDGNMTILPPKEPPPLENRMKIENASALAGEQGTVPVLGSSARKASGFTSIIAFDSDVVEVLELDTRGTPVETFEPDLIVPEIRNAEGFAIMTVIFELFPPFERIGLEPGIEHVLFHIRFRIKPDAPPGVYSLRFVNDAGTPPKNNIFVFEEGVSEFPSLVLGSITVKASGPRFIRGDVDAGGKVDLGDAVALTDHLFRGGAAPPCRDAGDTDDNGKLELTDAIFLLNHLFKGGPGPEIPYPEAGNDPTSDGLDCLGGL